MGMKAAFEAMQAKLAETVELLGIDPPSYGLGRHELASSDTAPRIVWVPARGSLARAKGESGLSNPAPLWTRSLRIEAHVWADDVDGVEQLAGHMIAALTEAGIAHAMTDEVWDESAKTENGALGVFAFEIKLTFTREALKTVQAETPVVTGHIDAQVVA